MKPVSVIIPVYNEEKTLRRTVQSVLNQTLTPAEVILVDDGSSDGSSALCDELARQHPCIHVIHMDDEGVSAARNRGLASAGSQRVTFLDGDDAMEPDMLEKLSALMDSTGAAITGCGFRGVSISDARMPSDDHAEDTTARNTSTPTAAPSAAGNPNIPSHTSVHTAPEILQGDQIVTKALLMQDTRVWSKLFDRSKLPSMQFREGLTIGEDMLFVLSLLDETTRYARTKEELYLYTINPAGLMERPFSPSYMDQITCWELAAEQIRQRFPGILGNPETTARLKIIQILSVLLAAQKIARLDRTGRQKYDREFQYCRKTLATYWTELKEKDRLDKKDHLKAILLLHTPALFTMTVRLYRRLQPRQQH